MILLIWSPEAVASVVGFENVKAMRVIPSERNPNSRNWLLSSLRFVNSLW